MSRTAVIRRQFAGDLRTFALKIGGAETLQDLHGVGLMVTLEHCTLCHVRAVRDVLRLALIGGGMPAEQAERVVKDGLTEGELFVGAAIAAEACGALLRGVEEEPLGEGEGEGGSEIRDPTSPTASSATPTSTGSAPA